MRVSSVALIFVVWGVGLSFGLIIWAICTGIDAVLGFAAGVFSALAIPNSVKFFAEHEYDD